MGNHILQTQQKENTPKSNAAKHTTEAEMRRERLYENPLQFGFEFDGASPPIPLNPQNVTRLQRTIGNRAVGQIMQGKLRIGQPGDKYEQEADRVADVVMRMPETGIQLNPT